MGIPVDAEPDAPPDPLDELVEFLGSPREEVSKREESARSRLAFRAAAAR